MRAACSCLCTLHVIHIVSKALKVQTIVVGFDGVWLCDRAIAEERQLAISGMFSARSGMIVSGLQ